MEGIDETTRERTGELDLHRAYRDTASQDLREELYRHHEWLATLQARRYERRGEPLEDLEQVARLALWRAIERFDPERGVKFNSYASKVIAGELKRHFRDRTWAMRVPRRTQELYLRARGAVEELRAQLGRSPTVADVASHLGVNEEEVLESMEAGAAYRLTSIDTPRPGAGGEPVADVGAEDPDFELFERRSTLDALLGRLSERERRMLDLYYVERRTQAEIGAQLGMSQVHVSRSIARITERLRALAR